jgi:hypothetical protein
MVNFYTTRENEGLGDKLTEKINKGARMTG